MLRPIDIADKPFHGEFPLNCPNYQIALLSGSDIKYQALKVVLDRWQINDGKPFKWHVTRLKNAGGPDQIEQPLCDYGGYGCARNRFLTARENDPEFPSQYDLVVIIENYMDLDGKDWAGILIYDVHGRQEYWIKYFCAEAIDKQLFHDRIVNNFTHKWGSPVTYGQVLHEKDPNIPADDWMSVVTGKFRRQALEEGIEKLSRVFLKNMKMITELELGFVVYPNWPKPGVDFKDWTPLFHNPRMVETMVNLLAQPYCDFDPEVFGDRLITGAEPGKIDYVVGLESRGIWLAVPLALKLRAGMIPIRKPGKIPGEILEERYQKEYGEDVLQIACGFEEGKRVLIVDDVLATGGSMKAAIRLVERAGLEIAGCAVVTDVPELRKVAEQTLAGYSVRVLIK